MRGTFDEHDTILTFMFNFLAALPKHRPELAIDLGTANTRVILRGEGVVFEEPSLCCFSSDKSRPRFVAAGRSVREMIDRVPNALQVRHPLARGVLQDMEAASALLNYALTAVTGKRRMRRPGVIIGIPADATKAESNALQVAAADAGFGKIELVKEPFAAAIGAGLPVTEARASMIVECGAGTTEIAVFSLDGECRTRSVRQGGDALDAALTEYLHIRHHFMIGRATAERLKKKLAPLLGTQDSDHQLIEVRGRDVRKGLPGTLVLPVPDFRPVFARHIAPLVEAACAVLGDISPDLAADLLADRIVATGGSASVGLMAEALMRETGIPVTIAPEEARCVSKGLEHLLDA